MATWTQFDVIGWRALLPLGVVFAIERWPRAWHRALADTTWLHEVRARPFPRGLTVRSVLLGALVCVPLLVHLLATVGEEFPYGGDEGYHFSATRTFARHLVQAGPWLVGLTAALLVISRVYRRHLLTLAVAALWALSVRFGPEMTFARYPAGFYFLASPLNMLAEAAGAANPHVNNHVMNTLSVVAWLFLLRPVLVRRWPDLAAVVAGGILFYQPTVVTFFGGGGLEPWSIVLLLVALEAASSLPKENRWVAVLVAGAAAWIKEPAILFLPLVVALSLVEWHDLVPRLRRGTIPLSIAAATPFITYYFVRHTLELPRFYAVVPFDDLFSGSRAAEWIDRIHLQFGDTGMLLLAGLALFAVVGVVAHRHAVDDMRAHVLLALFTLGLILFFYIDVQGVPYTGYGRYLMFPYASITAAVLLSGRRLLERGRALAVMSIAVFVLACQAYPLAQTLALDLRPDYTRNAREWYRCLIRLPFRELAAQIPADESDAAVTSIRLVTITLDTQITPVAYPDVARRYRINPSIQRPEQVDCHCLADDEAVIAGFEFRTHFDGDAPADPRVAAAERVCVGQLERSCVRSTFERAPDGRLVGALGVGAGK